MSYSYCNGLCISVPYVGEHYAKTHIRAEHLWQNCTPRCFDTQSLPTSLAAPYANAAPAHEIWAKTAESRERKELILPDVSMWKYWEQTTTKLCFPKHKFNLPQVRFSPFHYMLLLLVFVFVFVVPASEIKSMLYSNVFEPPEQNTH